MYNGYNMLANAIIWYAAEEYRYILIALKSRKCNDKVFMRKSEVELFFRSAWFGILTCLDSETLMRKIAEDVRYDR